MQQIAKLAAQSDEYLAYILHEVRFVLSVETKGDFSKLLPAIFEEVSIQKIVDHADDFVSVLRIQYREDPPASVFEKLQSHKVKFASHAETSALLSLLSLFASSEMHDDWYLHVCDLALQA